MIEMSRGRMEQLFREYNNCLEDNKKDPSSSEHAITGNVCFKNGSWFNGKQPEKARTFCYASNNKAFISGMGGYSIFASNLSGTDRCVRIENVDWEVQKCWMSNAEYTKMMAVIEKHDAKATAQIEKDNAKKKQSKRK